MVSNLSSENINLKMDKNIWIKMFVKRILDLSLTLIVIDITMLNNAIFNCPPLGIVGQYIQCNIAHKCTVTMLHSNCVAQ